MDFGVSDLLTFKNPDIGVDVNGNGENDYIEVFLTGFTADLSLDLITVDFLDGSGTPGLTFAAESVAFSGNVGNVGDVSTDPPFGPFLLSAPAIGVAPAPPSLALLLLGLPALVRARR